MIPTNLKPNTAVYRRSGTKRMTFTSVRFLRYYPELDAARITCGDRAIQYIVRRAELYTHADREASLNAAFKNSNRELLTLATDGRMTRGEIAGALKKNYTSVCKIIRRLKKMGEPLNIKTDEKTKALRH